MKLRPLSDFGLQNGALSPAGNGILCTTRAPSAETVYTSLRLIIKHEEIQTLQLRGEDATIVSIWNAFSIG